MICIDINLKFERGLLPAYSYLVFVFSERHGRSITVSYSIRWYPSTATVCYIHIVINDVNQK